MRSKVYSRFTLLVLSTLSLSVHAHDSLQALQQGGTLARLTAALLHPLLESGIGKILLFALPVLALLFLGVKRLAENILASRMQKQRIRRLGLERK